MPAKPFQRLLLGTLLIFSAVVHGETIRDYYAEPGINPFKESLNQNFNEHIDPFSGGVSLSYVDLRVPGNGGLDIVVNRVYNSVQNTVGNRTVNGVGWTMHFGRIVTSASNADKLCNQNLWSVSVTNNPSLERADGGREILFLANDPNAYLITRSRWKAECVGGQEGLVVTAPDGTVYIMDQYETNGSEVSWYTSRIEDTNGNFINISYKTGGGFTYIDQVTASDGRVVQFNYDFEGTTTVRLKTIVANNQIWEYKFSAIPELAGGQEQLAEVIRPDGKRWLYDYNPGLGAQGVAGDFSLKQVTYPYGGIINYTYQYVYFDPVDTNFPTAAIEQKTVSGPNITPGTWSFDYVPAITAGGAYDKTTVQTPNGKHVYFHYGYSGSGSGSVWRVGLLYTKETYDNADLLIEQEVSTWGPQVISDENYWHGRSTGKIDNNTAAPILLKKEHWRDDWVYTTDYLNYDAYGNPEQTVEPDNLINGDTRTATYTYYIDPGKWIINQVKDETIGGIGTIARTFDPAGNLLTEDRYGVLTTYTYTPAGDVATLTNARNKTTTFLDYYRGIARQENQPEQVSVSRTVNGSGTLASQTNGRGHTTGFSYDLLNRLTAIDFPINADVSVVWTTNGKRLTRDNLEEEVTFDGFGREINAVRKDLLAGISITTTLQYDALGNKVFESYPNSVEGTAFAYDPLGRVTRMDHPDSTFRTFAYLDPEESGVVTETDERGIATKRLYRAFGHPDSRELMRIDSPENTQTQFVRNLLGQITSVWQGEIDGRKGLQRDYVYDARYYMTQRTDPEIGDTVFGRDAMGNMISKTIATDPTIFYTYDDLDRLATVDYPGVTDIDVSYTYDKNSNIATLSNGISQRNYVYDFNNNLSSEAVTISGVTYNTDYGYSSTDVLSSIIYPSHREVTYAPDAFGRPTEVAPYLSQVSYHPSGQVKQMVYANGHITDIALTPRLFVDRIATLGVADLSYGYDTAGNVASITDAIDAARNLTLDYDGMNRLTVANGQWGTGTFEYDFYSNITQQVLGSKSLSYTYNRSNQLTRVTGSAAYTMSYDAVGNNESDGLYQYTYDAAGNLRSGEVPTANPVPFWYDSDNMRVMRGLGAEQTRYVYATNGNLLGEYGFSSGNDLEYIYLGSQMVARVKGTPPPSAKAGPDQTVNEGVAVTLDGSASSDISGIISDYYWSQVSGPTVTLTGANTATPGFTTPTGVYGGGTLVFRLTVTNGQWLTDSDEVTITVLTVDTDSDNLSDFWETQYFGDLTPTAADDSDGDGFTNIEEFQNGTSPLLGDPLPPIVGLSATSGNGQVTLTWVPVDRALGYDIYWSTQPGVTTATGTKIAGVTSPYVHLGLTNGQPLYYILAADNVCCESVSEEISAVPGMSGWVGPSFIIDSTVAVTDLSDFHNGMAGIAFPAETNSVVTNTVVSSMFYDSGPGWQAPVTHDTAVHQSANTITQEPLSPGLIRNADGSALYTWWVEQNGLVLNARTYTPASGWSAPLQVWSTSQATARITWSELRADSLGDAMLAFTYDYSNGDQEELVAIRYTRSGGWEAPTAIASAPRVTGSSGLRSTTLSVSEAGALLTYRQVGAPHSVASSLYAQRYVPSTGWEAATLLGNGFTVTGAMDVGGNLAATWFEQELVKVKRYTLAGGWQETEAGGQLLWPEEWGGRNELRAVYDKQGDLHIAWVAPDDGGYLIYDFGLEWLRCMSKGEIPYGGVIFHRRFSAVSGWAETTTLEPMLASAPDYCGHHSMEFALTASGDGDVRIVTGEVAINNSAATYQHAVLSYRYRSGTGFRNPVVIKPFSDITFAETLTRLGAAKAAVDDNSGNLMAMFELAPNSNTVAASRYVQIPGAPFAHAGSSQDVQSGNTVVLDGSNSVDSDGVLQSYTWTQLKGPAVTLDNANSVMPGFTAPAVAGPTELVFKLTVGDDVGLLDADSVRISVFPPSTPPVANAGVDQTVFEGTLVTLDGTASIDADGTITQYLWTQMVEPLVTLDDILSATPTFTAPDVTGSAAMTFTLMVTDDAGLTASDTVVITVTDQLNAPPVGNAGVDQTVNEGMLVQLDGSSSTDSDGTIVSHLWSQTAGPPVTLDDATLVSPSFTAPMVSADTPLSFELQVTDDQGAMGTDTVVITVQDATAADVTPPVTTANLVRTTVKGAASYDIDFSVDEAATTYFRVTGDATITSGGANTTAWQTYSGTTVHADIAKRGTANLDYYSVDTAGNTEATRTEVLQ